MFQIFQGKVLQFAFQRVETQFVCQWRVKISRFDRHAPLFRHVGRVFDVAHDNDTPGDEQQHVSHVARLRHKEVAEVVGLHGFRFCVELLRAQQTV